MFDIGWAEMALIAVVAVIVIGPKELPKVMRELGTWVSRARAMSRVFMDQLDEMSRQSGIDEVRKEAEALRHLDPVREIEKTIDPDGVIARQTADLAQLGESLEPPLPQPASSSSPSPPSLPSPEAGSLPAIAAADQPESPTSDSASAIAPALPPRGPAESTP